MGLVILAALAGLLGPGPLSSTQVGDARLRVEYERFQRNASPAVLKVRLARDVVDGDEVALVLDDPFVETFRIEKIVPTPAHWQLSKEGMRLRFETADLGAIATIRFHLTPQSSGPAAVSVGLAGGPPIVLRPFIYP